MGMKIGGTRTKFLFPDMLEGGKEYPGVISSFKMVAPKTSKGREFPVLVWLGALDHGDPREWEISAWNVESDVEMDIETVKGHCFLKKRGDRIHLRLSDG